MSTGGITNLNYYDYIVIFILIISIVFGIYKGFISSAGSIVVTVAAWIGALLFADNLALYLQQKTDILEKIIYYVQANERIDDLILRKTNVVDMTPDAISSALGQTNIPAFFQNKIIQNISNQIFPGIESLGDYVDYTVGSIILNIICFIGILFVITVAGTIVKSILEEMIKIPALKYFDGMLGAGFGAIRGIFFVYIFCMLIPVLILVLPDAVFTKYLGDISDSKIASAFYNNNILMKYIGGFIKIV